MVRCVSIRPECIFLSELRGGDRKVNLGQNRRKKRKKNPTTKFLGGNFLKMVNGGPDPDQAAGTVFRPKIESQHIFSKIIILRVIFKGHPCRI